MAGKLIRQDESFSGVLRPEEMKALFAIDASEGSAALSDSRRLKISVCWRWKTVLPTLSPEDGTLFLDYLAEVIDSYPPSQAAYPLTEHIDPDMKAQAASGRVITFNRTTRAMLALRASQLKLQAACHIRRCVQSTRQQNLALQILFFK